MNIAIFTTFNEFNPGYSLTGIVVDQAEMLAKYGHRVYIFVNENFDSKHNEDIGLSSIMSKYLNIFIVREVKFIHLKDYQTKENISEDHIVAIPKIAESFYDNILELGIDVCFTHDYIFTGWNLPYAEGMKIAQQNLSNKSIKWFHWIHSIPSGHKDWWNLNRYPGYNYIVFPTRTEVNRVAESFLANQSQVLLIPHIKDIRNWYGFSKKTRALIDEYPGLLQKEIVQVYPCSSDRLHAKQLHLIIKLFGFMKKAQSKVFLLAVNQWATGKQRKEDISKYIQLAEHCGLVYGDDFAFTSEYEVEDVISENEAKDLRIKKPYETGVSRTILRELQLLSSLFIFPTTEESFGLVGPEASFSGALVISNKSLPLLTEVLGLYAPHYDFGSFHGKVVSIEDDNYLIAIAHSILGRIRSNDAVMTKSFCRRRYNMDNIYYRYYLPYLAN